ncbi:hypothetical protein PtA15_2A135 [Puccinia triticina]|uniref:Uncharacterized protein n=1 Tax=Puccinia triticina TaxID=208348 RepID=A0ABY7CBR4_9BASI|nr:uncharacterized protein PtA15_2A135 [Puccinia triticina]WAQ81823.1 hypothetical protein PtA15_2A135 [Puccinia triticina]WAR52713.1 hypothetical protein PtB15_2B138 [Puccinia triticina]
MPLNNYEQGDNNDNLARALNLDQNRDPNCPTTPDQWSNSEQGGNNSPVNTLGQPSPDFTQALPAADRPEPEALVATGTQTPAPSPSVWAASMQALASQQPNNQGQRRVSYERRQLELNVQIRELEILRAWATFEAEQASGAAFTQARMLQDFIRLGLTPAEACNMTDEVLGVVGSGPLADSNE